MNKDNKTVVVSGIPEERFEKYGATWPEDWEIRFTDRTYTPEVMADADYLVVDSMDPVTPEILDSAPQLKMVHTEGVSFNMVDTYYAAKLGIMVCNNRAVNKVSVAEHCISMMLAGAKHIHILDHKIRAEGYVSANKDFLEMGVGEIAGKTVGMIGMGAIGREVLKRLQGWDCRLCYYDPFRMPEEAEKEMGVTYADLDTLLKVSDSITIHVPVVPSTIGMIGRAQLELTKPTATLVNVSRGSIIDDEALAWALENDRLGCAALDTIDPEPLPPDHVLLKMSTRHAREKLVLTTHSAGKTTDAFRRMLEWTVSDCTSAESGLIPANVVNGVKELRSVQ